MVELTSSTAAILVTYHPASNPRDILERLAGLVALTVVVDNSIGGHPALQGMPNRRDRVRIHNRNRGGLAGAYNQAISRILADHRCISHIVFIDEDSDPTVLGRFLANYEVARLLQTATTACVAPAYKDRATGLRGRHIVLGRFHLTYLPRLFAGVRRVAFVINSMSVWRMEALRRIGPFNEGLAIDHIDIGVLITRITDELPRGEDVERVRARLAAKGWPLDDPRDPTDDGPGDGGAA